MDVSKPDKTHPALQGKAVPDPSQGCHGGARTTQRSKNNEGDPPSCSGTGEEKQPSSPTLSHNQKLFMLYLSRALNCGYTHFCFVANLKDVGVFGDFSFSYPKNIGRPKGGKYLRFFQSTNTRGVVSENVIRARDLLNEGEGEHSLQRYFGSYRRIKNDRNLVGGDNEVKDLIVCTDKGFKFGDSLGDFELNSGLFEKVKDDRGKVVKDGILHTELLRFKEDFAGREKVVASLKNGLNSNLTGSTPEKVAKKFADLLKRNRDSKKVIINDENSVVARSMRVLANHVLEEIEGTVRFSVGFLDGAQLPGNLKEFRVHLIQHLSAAKIEFDGLEDYRFQVSNFPKRGPEDGGDDSTNGEIRDFLEKLVFALNQPGESDLDSVVKDVLGKEFDETISPEAYSKFLEKSQGWLKDREGHSFTLQEAKIFFEGYKKGISGQVKDPATKFGCRDRETRRPGEKQQNMLETNHYLAKSLYTAGKYKDALAMYESLHLLENKLFGGEHSETVETKYQSGLVLHSLGKYDEAMKIFNDVLTTTKSLYGEFHPNVLITRNSIASTLVSQGKYEDASKILSEIVGIQTCILGEDHQSVLNIKCNIASLLCNIQSYDNALKLYEEVLESEKKSLGENHPNTLTTKSGIAIVLIGQGNLKKASKILFEVYEKRKEILGKDHPDTLKTMTNISTVLLREGNFEEGLEYSRGIYDVLKVKFGDSHPDSMGAKQNIAAALKLQGKRREALKIYEEVYEKQKEVLGENHPRTQRAKICMISLRGKNSRQTK